MKKPKGCNAERVHHIASSPTPPAVHAPLDKLRIAAQTYIHTSARHSLSGLYVAIEVPELALAGRYCRRSRLAQTLRFRGATTTFQPDSSDIWRSKVRRQTQSYRMEHVAVSDHMRTGSSRKSSRTTMRLLGKRRLGASKTRVWHASTVFFISTASIDAQSF